MKKKQPELKYNNVNRKFNESKKTKPEARQEQIKNKDDCIQQKV